MYASVAYELGLSQLTDIIRIRKNNKHSTGC